MSYARSPPPYSRFLFCDSDCLRNILGAPNLLVRNPDNHFPKAVIGGRRLPAPEATSPAQPGCYDTRMSANGNERL